MVAVGIALGLGLLVVGLTGICLVFCVVWRYSFLIVLTWCFFAGLFAGLCLFNGVVGVVACWGLGVLRYCAQVWTSV